MRVSGHGTAQSANPLSRDETQAVHYVSAANVHNLCESGHITCLALPMNTSRKALPTINTDRCTGCGWCVAVCPPHVLSLQVQGAAAWGPKRAQLHGAADCTGCALCAVRCPFDAIGMVPSPAAHATDAVGVQRRRDVG